MTCPQPGKPKIQVKHSMFTVKYLRKKYQIRDDHSHMWLPSSKFLNWSESSTLGTGVQETFGINQSSTSVRRKATGPVQQIKALDTQAWQPKLDPQKPYKGGWR